MSKLPLTDAQIREAFDRRAQAAVPADLRSAVLAAVAIEPQGWGWTARATDALKGTPTRRAIVVFAGVALLVATMLAVSIVGSHDQPLPGPGRGLAFISGGDLWVADLDGTHARLVWDTPGAMVASRPTWVNPNTVLVQEITGGVYVVDLLTSTARLLPAISPGVEVVGVQTSTSQPPPAALLAISPDHRTAAIGLASDIPYVYTLDIASGSLETGLVVKPTFVEPVNPQIGSIGTTGGPRAWSPDGRWLLGQGLDTNDSSRSGWIYQLDLQTGEIHDLARELCCGLDEPNPVLAPDGSSVVYVDYHDHETDPSCGFRCGSLWSLDPVTKDQRRLTAEAGSEIGPHFSPDGAWIAFAESVGSGYDLSIVRADGMGRRKLTSVGDVYAPSANVQPYAFLAWDADGRGLTFMRGPSGQTEWSLWHVTLDGLQLQRLGTITAAEFTR
jgi:hypothetical protein